MAQVSWCASLEISIANERCRGRFLEALVYWSSQRFSAFEFSVGDTLRIYDYVTTGHPRLGRLTMPEAHAIAESEGKEWISQNYPRIEDLLHNRNYRIVTWDEWKRHPGFESNLLYLTRLCEQNESFQTTLLQDIRDYIQRKGHAVDELDRQQRGLLCTYLLEELAVYQIQAEARPTINIYPGGQLHVFRRIGSFHGMPHSLVHRNYIYFEFRSEPCRGR